MSAPKKPAGRRPKDSRAVLAAKAKGGEKGGSGRGLYRPEFATAARKLCQMGALDKDLAEAFDVSPLTIIKWRHAHPEFAEACAIGKEAADDMVERALFHRATGFEHPAEKIFQNNGEVIRAEYVERYPPDTAAAIFWLKNRRKKDWRDRQELEVTDSTPTGELLRKARERLKRRVEASSDAS